MPRSQPPVKGKKRKSKKTYIHKEVINALKQIAKQEDKSFSWVVAEIIQDFFHIKIKDNVIVFRRKAS